MLLHAAAERGTFTFPVRGSCMQPILNDGDVLDVRAQPLYLPGEIVVFRGHDGRLLAHRLLGFYWRRGVWKLVARADGAGRTDVAVPVRDLIGAVYACNGKPLRKPNWHRRLYCAASFARTSVVNAFPSWSKSSGR